ncbi:MAG: DUF5110 domain-containing protein, partial [Armatimonadetes bacterium]|nr:DUF5110 domain-containing protein [Anaerolineae bacterium]
LLVASVLEPGARTRAVYLPEGAQWVDFYTGKRYDGGQTVTLDAPLERNPLLARAGAIIPMGRAMQHVGAQPDDLRELYLFPHIEHGTGTFTLYEDDGTSLTYQRGAYTELALTLTSTPHRLDLTIDISGAYPLPYRHVTLRLPAGEARPLHVTLNSLMVTGQAQDGALIVAVS